MSAAVRLPFRQGTPEWIAARRGLITATDIPVLMGDSPYKCEAQLADEKRGLTEPTESNLRMRMGLALEPLIAEEYERSTGRRLRQFHGLFRHPGIAWAGASPDFGVVGERRLVETKYTGSRSRFAEGLPQDIEAQVAWQLFVTSYPRADVAALVANDEVRIFTVEADPVLADQLVTIAADFRRRLADGGPFAQNADSLRRRYPRDSGAEMTADTELADAVRALGDVRGRIADMEKTEERLKNDVKGRMGEVSLLTGPGFRVTWKRSKDGTDIDWRGLAASLLDPMPEAERAALVGTHTTVREGFRTFRVAFDKED